MDKKILAIVIAAIVLTLGVVVAINYNDSSKGKDSGSNIENTVDKNDANDVSETNGESENEINNQDQDKDKDNSEEPVEEANEEELAVGKLAPDFTLKNLEGKEVSLSDYKGKIVLINFWATWCKYCDIEMPDLDAIDKENDDVVVLAVDVSEELSKVKNYIEKGGYQFETILDSDGAISRQYLVSAYPTTYAVNKEGIMMGGVPGMMTKPQMEQIIENVRTGN